MRRVWLIFSMLFVAYAQSQPPSPAPAKQATGNQTQASKKTDSEPPTDRWGRASTFLVTIFTGVLAWLAYRQWRAMVAQAEYMRGQLEATRQMFAATRRPRLAIRYMSATDGVRHQRVNGTFDLFNVGEINAVLRASYSEILAVDRLPAVAPYEGDHGRPFVDTALLPGQSIRVAFPTTPRDLTFAEFAVIGNRTETAANPHLNLGRTGELYVLGWVEYADDAGAIRMMGFCRKYNFLTERFERYADPDYEYDDYG